MGSRIKKQALKNTAGQEALEQLVLEAHADGRSLRQIASYASMTPEGIRKMLARALKVDSEPGETSIDKGEK